MINNRNVQYKQTLNNNSSKVTIQMNRKVRTKLSLNYSRVNYSNESQSKLNFSLEKL